MTAGSGGRGRSQLLSRPPTALSASHREAILISAKCNVASSKVTRGDARPFIACATPNVMKRASPGSGPGEAHVALMMA